jgi:DNA-binding response OmpR family regulator
VLTKITPSPQRLLLVDLGEHDRHELWERLTLAGFDVMIALNHADACLRLLTWRPHGVIADGDLSNMALPQLANLIRTSTPVPVAVVFLCGAVPLRDVGATVLLKPVAFADLLATVRGILAEGDELVAAGQGRQQDGSLI